MKLLLSFCVPAAILSTAALAGSSFQNTCSNFQFSYLGNDAGITATCLTSNGDANQTSIVIRGISNQNGILTQDGAPSSFQKSCGNIGLWSDLRSVTLTANCRAPNGEFIETSIEIDGISNQDGVLSY
ncbi:CVNH domain-containing protein [Pseudophaeobacter sp.]|uniref:mannose-binding lectin n=1 Tax=Pseudophaeobacter sp. TaxID=1971739 RepID=UPI00260DB0EA|nr:CVNH domain-containing protein [Pseudophaeobacter sp.]